MTYKQSERYIDSLKPSGMKFGLDRISRALSLCNNPERQLKFIHVAGTNGKGSVSGMIQAILTAAGFKTGLFRSPAVTGLRDTVTIDGLPVSKRSFSYLAGKLRTIQCKMGDVGLMSEFEFLTALALLYFESKQTHICVIECGLGGRDDATNAIPAPLAAVFTPISLDHTAVLGNSIGDIAANKCGIIKPPCHVVTSHSQDDEALAVIMQKAAKHHLTVNIPFLKPTAPRRLLPGITEFEYDGMNITMSLTGEFQIDNALIAIETVRLVKKDGFSVSNQNIEKGLASVKMPCRQEVLRSNPLVMIDGAHNPHGVGALANELRRHSIKGLTLVCGMLADKDTTDCMALLAPLCCRAVCCTPDNPRALKASQRAEILKRIKPSLEVEIIDSPVGALKTAMSDSSAPLLVAGSFYVASALRPVLKKTIKVT